MAMYACHSEKYSKAATRSMNFDLISIPKYWKEPDWCRISRGSTESRGRLPALPPDSTGDQDKRLIHEHRVEFVPEFVNEQWALSCQSLAW